jgi:surface-anchored protein
VSGNATNGYDLDYAFTEAGTYTVTVTVTGTDQSTVTDQITITVTSNQAPTVEVTAPIDNYNQTGTATIALEATATDDNSVASVSFQIWDGATLVTTIAASGSGSTYTASWTPTTAGTYAIRAVAIDNESSENFDEVTITIEGVDGVQELLRAGQLRVFPNPSADRFTVMLSPQVSSRYTLVLRDLNGNEVMRKDAAGSTAVDWNAQPNGVYFLNIITAENTYTTKVTRY